MRLVAGRACPDRGGSCPALPGVLHGGRKPEVCPVPVVTGKADHGWIAVLSPQPRKRGHGAAGLV
ncbi:MAG: hypothetical protein Q8O73_00375 [Thalassospira sp.]|nr:hypothetical protein [Thalassospira sp.]